MIDQLRADRPEVAVAAAVTALALVESLTANVHGHRLAAVVGMVAIAVSLLWRVRWPFVPAVITATAAACLTAIGVPLNSTIALTVALVLAAYSGGAHLHSVAAAGALAILAVGATISVLLDDRSVASNLPFALLLCGVPWAVGVATRRRHRYTSSVERERDIARQRAEEVARRAEEEKAAAIAAERARIARELHDVVTHTLTVIGLQAGGARRLLHADQQREREALMVVEEASRQAHADMRRLLSLLRENERDDLAPQPGLNDLPALCATVRATGMEVDYCRPGDPTDPPVPAGVQLAAYRIVQEAITNAQRHADATRIAVHVDVRPAALAICVTDNGTSAPGTTTPGFGLIGMRERVGLYGGTLETGFMPGGGFRIAATIPVGVPA